jgi:hypothetical protein
MAHTSKADGAGATRAAWARMAGKWLETWPILALDPGIPVSYSVAVVICTGVRADFTAISRTKLCLIAEADAGSDHPRIFSAESGSRRSIGVRLLGATFPYGRLPSGRSRPTASRFISQAPPVHSPGDARRSPPSARRFAVDGAGLRLPPRGAPGMVLLFGKRLLRVEDLTPPEATSFFESNPTSAASYRSKSALRRAARALISLTVNLIALSTDLHQASR